MIDNQRVTWTVFAILAMFYDSFRPKILFWSFSTSPHLREIKFAKLSYLSRWCQIVLFCIRGVKLSYFVLMLSNCQISSQRFLFSLDFWILELKFILHIEIFRHTGLFKNWHKYTHNNQLHQLKKLFLFWNIFSQFGFKKQRAPLKSMLLLPK